MRLGNKVAVVTGYSSGIGEAIALAFAEEGAAVIVNYSRHEDVAQKVLEKIEGFGGKGLVVGADVSDPKEVEAMVQQAASAFGRLDITVNNAGMERKIIPKYTVCFCPCSPECVEGNSLLKMALLEPQGPRADRQSAARPSASISRVPPRLR